MPDHLKLLAQLLGFRQRMLEQQPVFSGEGPQFYPQALGRNLRYATAEPSWTTKLMPHEEIAFRQWVAAKKVPFDPDEQTPDYDMRGYFRAMQAGQAEPWNGPGSHFPDTFKTPRDTTFSAESKNSKASPLVWYGDKLLNLDTGEVIK